MYRPPARLLTLLLLAVVAVAGAQSSAVAATPTTTVTLPIKGFDQMQVDPASHHVFITGSTSQQNSSIAVLASDGSLEGTIPDESGAGGMVIDGSTLYVARCGWGVIDEIDTTTLTKVGSIPATVEGSCKIGVAGGQLWYATGSQWTTLTSVTIASPNTVTSYPALGLIYNPEFLSVPGNPNEIYVADGDTSTSTVRLLDVSGATPVQLSKGDLSTDGEIEDWVVSSDGSTMYVAAGSPYELDEFHTSDLSLAGVYPTGPYPGSVDLSPSGTELVGGISQNTDNVQEFPVGTSTADLAVNTADSATVFTPEGAVRYSEDGSRVFSVTTDLAAKAELHVTSVVPPSTLTIADGGAKTAPLGAVLHLSGILQLPGGADPAGQTVDVSATMPGGGAEVIGQATANAAGSWSIGTPALKPAGSWTFHASFAGGAYPSSSASVGISVGNPEPSLTVAAASAVTYGSAVKITVHLAKWHTNRTVTLYRSTDGSTPVQIGSGTVSSTGIYSYIAHPSKRSVYSARWAGDDTYLPKTSAGKVVLVRARLSVTQSGFYRTSGLVRLYHYRSGCWTDSALCPHFSGHLAPVLGGRPIRFTLQKLVSGRWETALAGTAYTGNGGLSGVIYRYTGTSLIGHVVRVHATWAGDSDYLAATSPWVELELTH